jgi:hypothetical protein
MLGEYALVLQRHGIAGKIHHPCAQAPVQPI